MKVSTPGDLKGFLAIFSRKARQWSENSFEARYHGFDKIKQNDRILDAVKPIVMAPLP